MRHEQHELQDDGVGGRRRSGAALSAGRVRRAGRPRSSGRSRTSRRSPPGSIQGVVQDEQGAPVAGAIVSALGATTAFAVTDRGGRFELRTLSPGPYLVRAHLTGFVALARAGRRRPSERARLVVDRAAPRRRVGERAGAAARCWPPASAPRPTRRRRPARAGRSGSADRRDRQRRPRRGGVAAAPRAPQRSSRTPPCPKRSSAPTTRRRDGVDGRACSAASRARRRASRRTSSAPRRSPVRSTC